MIDPNVDTIEIDNQISQRKFFYAIYHKPKWIMTVNANRNKKEIEIKDIIDLPPEVVPIGRLDKDSSGLILLTDDTVIQKSLLDPNQKTAKTYLVKLIKAIKLDEIEILQKWVMIDWYITAPCDIKKISDKFVEIIIFEGKNRQIRKMFASVGNEVLELQRVKLGKLKLGNLQAWNLQTIQKSDIF